MSRRFGVVMKSLRALRGWTQEEVAERAGVTIATVSNWENAVHSPRLDELPSIAAALGVTTPRLLELLGQR